MSITKYYNPTVLALPGGAIPKKDLELNKVYKLQHLHSYLKGSISRADNESLVCIKRKDRLFVTLMKIDGSKFAKCRASVAFNQLSPPLNTYNRNWALYESNTKPTDIVKEVDLLPSLPLDLLRDYLFREPLDEQRMIFSLSLVHRIYESKTSSVLPGPIDIQPIEFVDCHWSNYHSTFKYNKYPQNKNILSWQKCSLRNIFFSLRNLIE